MTCANNTCPFVVSGTVRSAREVARPATRSPPGFLAGKGACDARDHQSDGGAGGHVGGHTRRSAAGCAKGEDAERQHDQGPEERSAQPPGRRPDGYADDEADQRARDIPAPYGDGAVDVQHIELLGNRPVYKRREPGNRNTDEAAENRIRNSPLHGIRDWRIMWLAFQTSDPHETW